MFKRILAAIDDTEVSQIALQTAIDFAKNQKAKLRVIHVMHFSGLAVGGEGVNVEALQESTKVRGKSILNTAKKLAEKKKIKIEKKLIISEKSNQAISKNVVDEADRWKADLLIVGTHKHWGLKRWILGSVAAIIMKESQIPVLLISRKNEEK